MVLRLCKYTRDYHAALLDYHDYLPLQLAEDEVAFALVLLLRQHCHIDHRAGVWRVVEQQHTRGDVLEEFALKVRLSDLVQVGRKLAKDGNDPRAVRRVEAFDTDRYLRVRPGLFGLSLRRRYCPLAFPDVLSGSRSRRGGR